MKNLRVIIWAFLLQAGKTFQIKYYCKFVILLLYGVFPLLVLMIGIGFWEALGQVNSISSSERSMVWLLGIIPLALWFFAITILGQKGVYTKSRLAIPLSVIISPVIGLLLFMQ